MVIANINKIYQNIYFSIAICYQALNKQEISKETRAIYEKNLLDNLFLAHEAGHEKAWGLFLLNIFEVKELSLARFAPPTGTRRSE